MNIIIVEDEVLIAMFLEETIKELSDENTILASFTEDVSLLNYLKDNSADLIFMDIKIDGDKDGIELACEIKKKWPSISIVFITSYKDSKTIQRAKKVSPLGYLTKPIVESDIEAILMVVESSKQLNIDECLNKHYIPPYSYDYLSKELYHNYTLIKLTRNETSCLEYLVQHKNNYVKQNDLMHHIWGDESNRLSSLRELMSRLRKKLPLLVIENISKLGYMLLAQKS